MPQIITIDGPAGSGKSTVSRLLAREIRFIYLDTGAMYRAVALAGKRKGIDFGDRRSLGEVCRSLNIHFRNDMDPPRLFLEDEDISEPIRTPEMDLLSSRVSAVREVRDAMTDLQRKMSEGYDLVAEGRDMGTVVFPGAKHKFFLTASSATRVERRYTERVAKGESVSKAVVEAEMKQRDLQDKTRAIAPLKPAEDAITIDTTKLTPDEVVGLILTHLGAGCRNPVRGWSRTP